VLAMNTCELRKLFILLAIDYALQDNELASIVEKRRSKQPRSEGGAPRRLLPNAKTSRLSSSRLNLPFSIPCLPLGQVHHQFNNAASDIYQYISFIVTNSFIATNMFSELVGLTYKHKETFFVTLWLDAKDLRALLRNEIRLSSFFL
jgi:hypothetical protein